MAQLNQDLSQTQTQNFDPLPAGEYPMECIDSGVGESKAGNLIAKFTWRVIGEHFANRQVFDNLVISGSNPDAVRIGKERLKTMAVACGLPNPNFIRDTEEFHGRSCVVKVKIDSDERYGDRNKVVTFKPRGNDGQPGTPASPTSAQSCLAASPIPANNGGSKKPRLPWEKPEQSADADIPF